MSYRFFIVCLVLVVFQTTAFGKNGSEPDSMIPLEAFTHLPLVTGIQLSPNGEYVAMLRNHKGQTLLLTQKLYSQKMKIAIKSNNETLKIRWYRWANNERLLLGVIYPGLRGTAPTHETRLLAVDRDGSDLRDLVKTKMKRQLEAREWESQFRDNVIDILPDDRKHVLISVDLKQPGYPTVYRTNIYTGKRSVVKKHEKPIRGWLTDSQSNVRVGSGFKGRKARIIVYDLQRKNWRTAWKYKIFDAPTVQPLGFGVDPNILYIRYPHEDKQAIFTVDIREKELPKTLVASNPDYDISGSLIKSPKTHKILAAYYVAESGKKIYLDETYKAYQKAVDKALPDTINYIISTDRDETRAIVYASSLTNPGTYYFGDLGKASLTKIVESYPGLNASNLVGKKAVSYKARDGLEISAYLTMPKGDHTKPLPAIIHPHGGPAARDFLVFDIWTELLASRGYVVLQMDFRGSAGHGTEFAKAGRKRWGLEMQDDITDGALWLIEQGIADPDRIGIVGVSYGGYAALMGAVKTPDLYQCSVSFAGVSDLKTLVADAGRYREGALVKAQIGSLFKDRKQLAETSPLRQVGKIRVPVLLAHGDQDRVVPIKHSERMAEALKSWNKAHQYLVLQGGNHSLSLQRNRTLFFDTLVSFLDKHLAK